MILLHPYSWTQSELEFSFIKKLNLLGTVQTIVAHTMSSKFQFHDNSKLDFEMKFHIHCGRQIVDNNLNVIVSPIHSILALYLFLFNFAHTFQFGSVRGNNFHNILYNGVCVIISILWQTFFYCTIRAWSSCVRTSSHQLKIR